MANIIAPTARPLVTGSILRKVAAAMLPFYRKIAGSGSFAAKWSSAIVNADLSLMGKLLAKIPTLASVENYGTNGIGYFISFPFRCRYPSIQTGRLSRREPYNLLLMQGCTAGLPQLFSRFTGSWPEAAATPKALPLQSGATTGPPLTSWFADSLRQVH